MGNLELIRNIRLFKELDDNELEEFLKIAEEKKFAKGEVIIEEGTPGKALFIIKNGTVEVTKVDGALESELVKLFAGEHFGEMSLVENARTSARVKAYSDVVCLVIPKNEFQKIMDADYKIAAKVYKAFTQTLCDRLRQTSQDLVAWKPEFQA
jgi:CRP/FNR family cyclic AMP-dependent transcriptional regulator